MRRFLVLAIGLANLGSARGLEPREVVVVVNKNEPRSREVADHYCKLRGVPASNIVVLDLPRSEDISRTDYDERLVKPLRREMLARRTQFKVVLSVYGVPLRVGRIAMTEKERKESEGIRREITTAKTDLDEKKETLKTGEDVLKNNTSQAVKERLDAYRQKVAAAEAKVRELEAKDQNLQHTQSEAAVDSELMLLLWGDYNKDRWLFNPMYFQVPDELRRRAPPMMMTARLDGPSAEVAKRLVDDAVAAEEKGLEGNVYVDARGIPFDLKADPTGTAYAGYDESMREMARLLEGEAKLQVRLEDTDALFPPRSCPNCALYCGWYSLNHYVPCCTFNRGAVAWHLASFEAISLRQPKTQWCGNLLRDGAAATIGPVAEPYAVGFPKPAEFFGFLVTGEYTLVEAYSRSIMLTSWMMTLVGDPLYNPYKKSPRLKSSQVVPSPKGTHFQIGQ